jgi:hypothetical protein
MTTPSREPSPRLIADTLERLRADNATLSRLVTEMKEREAKFVRALSQMLNTPAQSVASAKYDDGRWEVVMTSGEVWARVERVVDTPDEYRYLETWVPRPAVPGSRPAIKQALDDALPAPLPFAAVLPAGKVA